MTPMEADHEGTGTSLAGTTVLVVDDDPSVRQALTRLLAREGCAVLEAESGAQGLEAARTGSPDLVVTDVNMPEMNGIEFLLAIQEQDPGLPVIAISGGGRIPKDSLLQDADLLGAVEVMAKPFEASALVAAVRRHLSR